MSKLYAVTKGQYSDYHIITLTDNKEMAEKIAKKFTLDWEDNNYDRANVEEFDNAEICLKPLYKVEFNIDGSIKEVSISDNEYGYLEEGIFQLYGPTYSGNVTQMIYISTDSKEKAIKIACDKRAEYFAEKEGIKL